MKTQEIKKRYASMLESGKLSRPTIMQYSSQEELDKLCLDWAKYIYGSYCSDECLVKFGGYASSGRSMRELRMYGRGTNSPEKYQKLLDPSDEKGEGYYNISWDTVKIYPSKFRNIVRGMMDSIIFDFQTNAIDSTARKERELEKNKEKIQVNPRMQSLLSTARVTPTIAPGTTSDEIDIMYKLGGKRLAYEIMMTAAILSTMYESGWEHTLRSMIVDDMIDLGIVSTDTYLERSTGKVKARYVDPEQIIARASKYPDGRDRDYAGYFEEVSLSELRMITNLPEREIYLIAKKYIGVMGNLRSIGTNTDDFYSRSFREEYMAAKGRQVYDNFRVQLMKVYFICNEAEKYIIGHHRDGNMIYDRVSDGAELTKRDTRNGKAFDEKVIQNVYSAYWIVGTDHIFDAQVEYGVVRQGEAGNKRATLPLKIWAYDGPSITESCIGYIDDINLATFKKRHLLSKLPPGPRMIIDKSKLRDSVTIGNETFSIVQQTGLFASTGIMVVESKSEFDMAGASQSSPIQFLPTGIVEDLNVFFEDIRASIDGLRSVTGINEVADGSLNREILVGVASGLQTATNNAIRPHLKVYQSIFRENIQYWMLKWQVAVLNGDIDVRYTPIGDDVVKAANITKVLMDYEFGITIEILPNDEEKILLLRHLFELMRAGGMRADDYFVAEAMIKGNKMKQAQLFISKALDARERELHARTLEQVRANGEANAITATASERARAETIRFETASKMDIAKNDSMLRIKEMREEFRLKMIEKGYSDVTQAMQQNVANE